MQVLASQQLRANWVRDCGREIDRSALIAAIGGLYVLMALAVTVATGKYHYFQIISYSGISVTMAGITLASTWIAYTIRHLLHHMDESYLRLLWRDARIHIFQPRRFLMYATPFVVMPFFIAAFTSIKSQIPFIHPFAFDVEFEQLDRLLHFGVEPWRITHALFGSDIATMVISYAYNFWFAVTWLFVFWHVYRLSRPAERTHYLVAFMLCWVLIGTVAAVGLSSAGPCYFAEVTGHPGPYGPLLEALHATDARVQEGPGPLMVWALHAQEFLWNTYETDMGHLGSGISAMPSMHVSIAVLMVPSGFKTSRLLGWLLIVYAILIQIGSVHLAWHYAIDGYLAAVLTIGVWYLTSWLMRRLGLDKD